jgi:hypothetical protein
MLLSNKPTLSWILMADIIASSQANGGLLQEQFALCTQEVNKAQSKVLLSPLSITLGDEFQGIVKNEQAGIETILAMEDSLLKHHFPFKIRYVLHQGIIETAINPSIAYGMLGPGLSKARELLAELKKKENRFGVYGPKMAKNTAFDNAFWLYDQIIQKWNTDHDMPLALEFIKNKDYKIVAEKTQKTRSQMWKRAKSLEINSYFAIRNLIRFLCKSY